MSDDLFPTARHKEIAMCPVLAMEVASKDRRISELEAESEQLRGALTLIELIAYLEAREHGWKVAHMNGCARAAQNNDSLEIYRRLVGRPSSAPEAEGKSGE